MTDIAWIDVALVSARPQAVAALLRHFRDLDIAEEAFQDACLRALRNWAENGPPGDPVSWLIMVGRNLAIDGTRRAKATKRFTHTARLLDAHLADRDFVASGRLSVADFCLSSALPWAEEAKLPLDDFANIHRWHSRLAELPAWSEPFASPARS